MKSVLCIGGSGHLGRKVIQAMSGGYNVHNVDFSSVPQATANFQLQPNASQFQNNIEAAAKIEATKNRYQAIVVTAGGWTGGSIKDPDYLEKFNTMINSSMYPSLLAAHLAFKVLAKNGLIIFTGAASVFTQPQPEMIGYALAKTAVHSLALNLAEQASLFNGRVITILPQTLDTEANRQAMPTADHSGWCKPEQAAELVKGWVDGLNVPSNGSFLLLKVKKGMLQPELV